MQFVAHMFRALQEDPAIASAPFAEAQLAVIAAGHIPGGDL